MKMQKNEFETICDSLEREYLQEADENRFRYAKHYLKNHTGNNYDRLKSIHAEAMDKIGDTYDKYLSMFSLIVSVLSFIVAAFALIITVVHREWFIDCVCNYRLSHFAVNHFGFVHEVYKCQ